MAQLKALESLLSLSARKRVGQISVYGRKIYGLSRYGQEESKIRIEEDDPIILSGIFRERIIFGKRYRERLPYYVPKNPQTESQQANRQKIADGVLAWQALTDNEKSVYNKKTIGRKLSGYNLFLKEYLKSN
jgi:hypothetical protein